MDCGNPRQPCQDRRCRGQDSKSAPPKYMVYSATATPTCEVGSPSPPFIHDLSKICFLNSPPNERHVPFAPNRDSFCRARLQISDTFTKTVLFFISPQSKLRGAAINWTPTTSLHIISNSLPSNDTIIRQRKISAIKMSSQYCQRTLTYHYPSV